MSKGKRRFQRGTDDLEQLKGIEKRQRRSRLARRELEKSQSDESPAGLPPLINRINKSKKRMQNRLDMIEDHDDAIREFGS